MCSRVLATIFLIYYFNSGLCEDLIDLPCTNSTDCAELLEPDQNVTCLKGECICSHFDGILIQCRPKKLIKYNFVGKPCPCSIANAVCSGVKNLCLCSDGYVASKDKLRCIQSVVHLENPCENSEQCALAEQFSECNSMTNRCQCQKNYISHQNACLALIEMSKSCQDDSHCENITKFSKCLQQQCVCREGFVAQQNTSTCLSSVAFGEKCSETVQCRRHLGVGSLCDSERCSCDTNHYYNVVDKTAPHCIRKMTIGAPCHEHHQCLHGECDQGSCKCPEGYIKKDQSCVLKTINISSKSTTIFPIKASLSLLLVFFRRH